MFEYIKYMFDLVMRKELQGIHFWASVYMLIVLLGSLWHALRVRAWPHVQGQLLNLGIRPLGGLDLGTVNQDYVPNALYAYLVNGHSYEGKEISIWKMSASGMLKGSAGILPSLVKPNDAGQVRVYYNPHRPQKSLLLRPGLASLTFLLSCIFINIAFYLWRW